MSEFIKACRLKATGNKRAVDPRFNPLSAEVNISTQDYIEKEYSYSVAWEVKLFYSGDIPNEGSYIYDLMERQLTHAVFDDFRHNLRELEYAIYDRDDKKARELIVALLERTGNR